MGPSFGAFGSGMLGVGRHGDGDAGGTVGSGPLGTKGGDHGLGREPGYDRAAGTFSERRPRRSAVHVDPPQMRGGLSKETIRRVIRRHLAEVRACYRERLLARPDLQGRLAVRFMIAPSGWVQLAGVQPSDLHDALAERCILNAVRRFTFPSPDGGGVVSVTYPFVLQRVGE